MKNGDDVGTVLGEDKRACHACRPQAFGDISNSTVSAQQQAVGDPAESGEPLDTSFMSGSCGSRPTLQMLAMPCGSTWKNVCPALQPVNGLHLRNSSTWFRPRSIAPRPR